MSSIITSLLKVTAGFLLDKARDWAVEKLRDGDVVDQKIREIIAREIEDVKSKLDTLSRKDILAAIDAFETGVSYLYKATDSFPGLATRARQRAEQAKSKDAVSLPTSPAHVGVEVLCAGTRNIELTEIGEGAKRALSQGKKRFKMAREEATKAFNNESLSTLDRITAIRYRVMAAILESAVEILGAASELSSLSLKSALKGALPECEQSLRKLHSLPDVKNNFKVELKKGPLNIRSRFKKEDRREIIAAVWQVNRAIYDVLQPTGETIGICFYPTIDIEDEKIDPRSDNRIAEVVKTFGIEHKSFTVWSFGEDAEDDHKLERPMGIAIGADGEFIIAEYDKGVKVFDSSGKFIYKFYPQVQSDDARAKLLSIATDEKNNTYVLVRLGGDRSEVQVFNRAELRMKFDVLGAKLPEKLRVGNGKVLVLADDEVLVYDLNGRYELSFRGRIINNATDIAVGPNGQIFVLDSHGEVCKICNEDGEEEHKFIFRGHLLLSCGLVFHPFGEYIFLVGMEVSAGPLLVVMYSTDGEFYRDIILCERGGIRFPSVAISKEGRLAVSCKFRHVGTEVFVL